MTVAMRDPLDCAAALIRCKNTRELSVCIAELKEHVDAYSSYGYSNKDESFQVLSTIAKSLVTRLNQATNSPEELLHLADSCFASCKGCAKNHKQQEAILVLTYSYIKKLVALKGFDKALQLGQQLLASLLSLRDGLNSSAAMQDLKLGAALNVILCSSKLVGSLSSQLGSMDAAATFALAVIRMQGGKAAQHAVVLTRYLLEVSLAYGAEAAASNAAMYTDSVTNLVRLLTQTWMAASLTQQQGMLQKVASQAFCTLPAALQHCTLLAMLQAAGWQAPTSHCMTESAGTWLSAAEALSGLKVLLSATISSSTTAAACVHRLLEMYQHGATSRESCAFMLILAAKCAKSLQASDIEGIGMAAAAIADKQQSFIGQEQQVDDLAGQLSGVHLDEAPANKRSTKQRCSKQTSGASGSVSSSATGFLQPDISAWCLQQLVRSPPEGPVLNEAYLDLLMSYLPDMTAQLQAANSTVVPQSALQTFALTASLIVQLGPSSCDIKRHLQLQNLVQSCQQLLAVPQLTQHLLRYACESAEAHENSETGDWHCVLNSNELQWLSWKLYNAAVSSNIGEPGACDTGCQWAAPDLLLLGWQCACACLAKACSDEQQQKTISKVEAVRDMLQHAQAYLSYSWGVLKQPMSDQITSSMPAVAVSSGLRQQWQSQQHNCMQDAMVATVALAAQHIHPQHGFESTVGHKLGKVLGLYSKLRCKSAGHTNTAEVPANSSSISKRHRRSGTQGQVPTVQQQTHHRPQHSSVLRLLLRGYESSGGQLPLDLIFWAEYSSLLNAAADARLPTKTVSAAMTTLVQELNESEAPQGWHSAVFNATRQLLTGMVISCTPFSLTAQNGSHESAEAASVALSAASSQYLALLSSAGCHTSQSAADSRSRGKQSKQRKCQKQDKHLGEHVQTVTSDAAEALASSHGCGTAAQVLGHAAFANCLLGLVKIATCLDNPWEQHQSSTSAVFHSEVDDRSSTEQQYVDCVTSKIGVHNSMSGGAKLLQEVCQHWQLSSQQLQLMLQQQEANSCSLLIGIRFPLEAAAAAAQAWHIAGLQGWRSCQQGFEQLLQCLLPVLPAQQRQQLEQLRHLMPEPDLRASWLSLLLAPQVQPLEVDCNGCTNNSDVQVTTNIPAKRSTAKMAEAKVVISDCRNFQNCHCQLEAVRKLHLLSVQQQDAVLADACSAVVLQQSRLHLAAGQAEIAVGDVIAAAVSAEAAIESSKAVMQELNSHKPSGILALDDAQGRHGYDASLRWHALGLYMSALSQLSDVLQLSGNPDDALRVLKELARVSSACFCCCLTAIAYASISSIYSRLGSTEKAAAAAADATRWQGQLYLTYEQTAYAQLLTAVTGAAVAQAQSACCTCSQQYKQAEQQLVAALATLHEAVQQQSALLGDIQDSRSSSNIGQRWPDMLLWKARNMQAQLQLQLAHLTMLNTGHAAALEQLTVAVQQLEGDVGSGCSRCQQTAWPMALATLRAQMLLWTLPTIPAPQVEQSMQLVGFVSSSSHSNLQAEFAHVAEQTATPAPKAKTSRGRKAGRASKEELSDHQSSSVSGHTPAIQDAAAWLADALSLLPACGHNVLVLKEVFSHVGAMLQEFGAVHGAAMMLQLSLGISVVQQQMLAASSKLARAQRRSAVAAAAAQDQDTKHKVLQHMQQHLNILPLLRDLAAAAGTTNSSRNESRLTGILSVFDEVGKRWLQQQLSQLPLGAAACSISLAASPLMPDGQTQLPYLLPATAALQSPANQGDLKVTTAGAGGLLVCRMAPIATQTDADTGDGLHQHCPLMVVLRPTGAGSAESLLAELSSILSDSSASMQASADLSSNSPAAVRWWKQRLALDERMAGLLRQLDQEWLGPWRCLVMQPGQQQTEWAATEAAQEFVTEHFEFVFEEAPRMLLTQLVAVLLVHLESCATAELHTAMRDLCQLTQQRVDGLHINKLVTGLTEMHAKVQTTAADSSTVTTASAQGGAASIGRTMKDASSTIHASIASAVDTAAASPAYTTPAAPKVSSRLGMMQTSAKKAPRSRLKTMQHKSLTAEGDGVDETCSSLTGLMVAKFTLEEDVGQNDAGDLEADHAAKQPASALPPARHKAKAPATTRRVRFAEEDSLSSDVGVTDPGSAAHHLVPPPSLARHAVRRSRLRLSHSSGDSSSGTSTNEATDPAPATDTDSTGSMLAAVNTPAMHKSRSRSGISSSTSGIDRMPQRRRQTEAWVPSVIVLLDGAVQQLPWESCAGLKQQNIYRCPSLVAAAAAASRLCLTVQTSNDGAKLSTARASDGSSAAVQALRLSSGFFLLNPDGDLQATQNTFEDLLQHKLGLQGVSGRRPSSSQLINALQQHDLFLYFGHGGGEQYVPLAALKRLDRCAGSLLMGCSSGRLKQAGVFEPSGAIWGYLTAGCPAAVANLWDVTDRDIDRFAQAILQQWAGSSSLDTERQGTNGHKKSKAGRTTSSSSSKHAVIGDDDAASKCTEGVQMCSAVAAARQACRLPHLIGAAAVCYGLPMCVANTGGQS